MVTGWIETLGGKVETSLEVGQLLPAGVVCAHENTNVPLRIVAFVVPFVSVVGAGGVVFQAAAVWEHEVDWTSATSVGTVRVTLFSSSLKGAALLDPSSAIEMAFTSFHVSLPECRSAWNTQISSPTYIPLELGMLATEHFRRSRQARVTRPRGYSPPPPVTAVVTSDSRQSRSKIRVLHP